MISPESSPLLLGLCQEILTSLSSADIVAAYLFLLRGDFTVHRKSREKGFKGGLRQIFMGITLLYGLIRTETG